MNKHIDVEKQAEELRAGGTAYVMATVVRAESPTSAKPGAKAIVTGEGDIIGWIGGGCAQPAVLDTAKKALKDGQSRLIRVSPVKGGDVEPGIIDFGMTCHSGGTLDIFIDPVIAKPALLIIGASPAAQTLAVLATHSGYDVHVAFPGADSDMFPLAAQIIDDLDLQRLQLNTVPYVVVSTQGKRDEAGLEAALTVNAPYTAFIASARKADKLREYLRQREHDAAQVDAIISPAGVEIGANTPEEIAVSVLAGLIQHRRSVVAAPAIKPSVAEQPAASCCGSEAEAKPATESCCGSTESGEMTATTAIDPICGMSVTTEGAEYVSEYQGQNYYFCCGGCQHAFEQAPQDYLEVQQAS